MHILMQFWHMPRCRHGAIIGAKQTRKVLARVLCHNMCVLIRGTRELGVEATFGAETRVQPKLFI